MSAETIFAMTIATIVVATVSVCAYNFFHGQTLISDLLYEFQIARSDIILLDRAAQARSERSDFIVSLTSVPSRMPYIEDTLKSLLSQTRVPAEIRIYLPDASRREDQPYDVPHHITKLLCVSIHRCGEDLGPVTKLIPALKSAKPDQAILIVDDDRIYPPNLIRDLEAEVHKNADAAYGFSGWVAPDDLIDRPTTPVSNFLERPPVPIYARRQSRLRAVDILQGTGGYLVRPRFFDLDALTNYSIAPTAARTVDDVWISAHCRAPKFVVPARRSNFQPWRRWAFYKKTSLGWINRASQNEDRPNSIMLRYFAERWSANARASRKSGERPRS